MWTAKIKYKADKIGILGKLAKKYGINIIGYPISSSKVDNALKAVLVGTLYGDKKTKLKIFEEVQKTNLFENISMNDDFFVVELLIKESAHFLYNPTIIYAKQGIIFPNGEEILELASFQRNELMSLFEDLKIKADGELLQIKKGTPKNISLVSVVPKLTKIQKEAFELALSKGYYNYPRKTSIKKLADIFGVSFSAFHAHLKKAENVLLPYSYNKLQ